MANNLRTYSELIKFPTFLERYRYLKIHSSVGIETFGYDRFINQEFYRSHEWKELRNHIIVRDHGCDLAIDGREIDGKIYIHHMNPLTLYDIRNSTEQLLNPEYLVCVSFNTHQAIHYGDEDLLLKDDILERKPGDTTLWGG